MNAISVLKDVRVFNLSVRLWTGKKKLRHDDLHVQKDDLMPEDLASLGHKKICDPAKLAVFGTLKRRMETLLQNNGVRFLGGYAIPETKVAEICTGLDEIVREGMEAKETFLNEYDQAVEDWIANHREWENAIRRAVTPKAVVESRISFGYEAFQILGCEAGEEDKPQNSGVAKAAQGLSATLLEEVADDVEELFERSLMGKDSVNRRVLSPIRTMRNKLNGLSFVDPVVSPIIQTIDEVLAKMPAEGPISGADLSALNGLVFILSNPEKMRKHGQMIIDGHSVNELAPAPVEEPVTAETAPSAEVSADPEPATQQESAPVPQSVVAQAAPAVVRLPTQPATVAPRRRLAIAA